MKLQDISKTLSSGKFWFELFIMTFGMLISSIAVYYFLVPGNLIVGHVTGFSMILCKVSESLFGFEMALSTVVLIINILLLLLSYFLIGKDFGLKTVYTALIFSPMLKLLETYLPWERFATLNGGVYSVMGDPWLDMLVYVLLLSFSQAMLFKINASTGGLDILGKIVNKYFHLDIGAAVSFVGILICCTAFAINPFNIVLLGLVGTWMNGVAIDYFTAGLNKKKRVCVISDEHERIKQYILNELVRGCTMYDVTGGYSNQKRTELQTLLSKDEFSKLMNYIGENNIDAFVTADTITEVYGFWGGRNKKKRLNRAKI